MNAGRGWQGPAVVHDYGSTLTHIVDVTTTDAVDSGLKMSNAEFVRPFGFLWSTIRLGLHFSFGFSGTMANPGLSLGVINLAGGGVGQSSTVNYLGASTADPTDVGQMLVDNQDINNPHYVIKPKVRLSPSGIAPAAVALSKVGTTYQSSAIDLNPRYAEKPTANSFSRRSTLIVDVEKGSPNYKVTLYVETAALAASDLTSSDFLCAMLSDRPKVRSENLLSSQLSIAASENPGTFDAISCLWPSSVPILVHAISARPLA